MIVIMSALSGSFQVQSAETYRFPRQSSRSWFSLLRELTFKRVTEKCTKTEMMFSICSVQGSEHSTILSHDEGWGLFFRGCWGVAAGRRVKP